MTIDSSGNLLVGTTDTNPANDASGTGVAVGGGGWVAAARSGDTAGMFNRLSSDGDIVTFHKDGATVGSIGNKGGDLYIGTGDTGLSFYDYSTENAIFPHNPATNSPVDASIDLGRGVSGSAYRFKDLYLSGGVYLGGTGSANKLDDYEEGSYTPTFLSTTGANPTVTYAEQTGTYTKVGNLITCFQRMRTSAVSGGSGNVLLGGLPFNCNDKSDETGGSIGLMLNITGATGYSAIQVDSSTNAIYLMKNDVNSAYPVSALGNNTYLRCTFQYIIE